MNKDLLAQLIEYGDSKTLPFIPGVTHIPVNSDVTNGDETSNIISTILGDEKDYLKSFTIKMMDYLGRGHVSACGSSSAQFLILKALSSESLGSRAICRGDEIITTASNFGIINAANTFGIIPIIVDVDLNTMMPSLTSIEMAIVEGKTKAIIIPSVCGNSIHGEMVKDIADDFSIMYIEDVGYGFGGTNHGLPIGSYADIAIYSFYSHILGDTSVIISKSKLVHDLIEDTTFNCISPSWVGFDSSPIVYSYLDAQLDKRDFYTSMRKLNWGRLLTGLMPYSKFFRFHKAEEGCSPSWAGFILTLKEPSPFSKLQIMDYLGIHEIESVSIVGNCYKVGSYNKSVLREGEELVCSDYINRNSFMIGCNPAMKEEHINWVIAVISNFVESYAKPEKTIED